jgi:predicted  nucleic acid-binding Zn-ribbon protein
MQPEISHRCESCGAVIREQAMFCPECGRALGQANAASSPSDVEKATPASAESAELESSAAAFETDKATAIDDQSPVITDSDPTPAKSDGPAEPSDQMAHQAAQQTAGKPGTYGKARDSLHRAGSAATSVARHALDDNVKRVEKIRHVSSAMIEEASYDPSLRFVLVALGLFVVFLVLLLLSKVMG